MRPGIAALLLIAVTSCASSAPSRGEVVLKATQFQLREFGLPSGMRVIVESEPSSPVVGVVTLVGVGSSSDPVGKEGLAHFVEHLAFRTRPTGDAMVMEWLDGAGVAYRNAQTSLDATTYITLGSKESLPAYIRIASRQLAQPVANITPAVFEIEREVVRNELRERGETNYVGQIFGWLQGAVFPPGHPYARPIGGTHESLNAITAQDARAFADRHYRPENATMIIFGDVDLEKAQDLLTSSLPPSILGDPAKAVPMPGRRLAAQLEEPPSPPTPEVSQHRASVATPEIWIAWSLPRGYEENTFLHRFIAASLNQQLAIAATDDRDIADVSASVFPGTRASMLIVRMPLRTGDHWERSLQRALNRLVSVWLPSDPVASRTTFARLRIQALTALALDAENPEDRMTLRASLTHFSGDPTVYSKTVKRAAEVDQMEVFGFAHRYVTSERARVVYVSPSGDEPTASTKATGVAAAIPLRLPAARFAPPPAQVMKEVMHPPGVSKFRLIRLPNGLDVAIGRRAGSGVVSAGLAFHGGTANPAAIGVADVAHVVVSRGGPRPADYGIRLFDGARPDFTFTLAQAAAGNVANVVQILSERLQSPQVIPQMLADYRGRRLPYLRRVEQSPFERGSRAFWNALYPGHPYGHRSTADDVDKIDESTIESWLRSVERPSNGLLVVVGDIEVATVANLVQTSFGGWGVGAGAPPVSVPPVPSLLESKQAKLFVTNRPGATQVRVLLGCHSLGEDPKGLLAASVASSLLQKELFQTIRSAQGGTYGLSSTAQSFRGGASHLLVSGNIDNDDLVRGLKTLRELWDALSRGEFDDRDLQEVIWADANRYNLRYATSIQLVEDLMARWNVGWPPASLDEYPALLVSIRKDDIKNVLQNCRATQVVSMIGDEAKVNAALKEAWH
jgi:zinc protease